MKKKSLKVLKETLLARRRDILEQYVTNRSANEVEEPADTGDAADAASNHEVKEQYLNVLESDKRSLAVIEEALARIEEGTYGTCADCGDEIPEKRLLAIPQAHLCVPCQERKERVER
jgi:DnaK suppressor protein